MKKWLAVLSAILLLVCAIPFCTVAVSAEQPTQNLLLGGDFEVTYPYDWHYYQNSYATGGSALHGNNGAYLQGNGGWGSLMEQTVTVELGRAYHLEFWYKVVSNGFNWRLEQSDEEGLYETRWETATEWTYVSYDFVASSSWVTLNFCGGGNGIAEKVYIDDAVLCPADSSDFDGYITNGDFERGNESGWLTYQGTYVSDAAGLESGYGAHLQGYGGWGALLEQGFATTPGVEYTVLFFYQVNQNGFNAQIKSGAAETVLDAVWLTATEWDMGYLNFIADSDYAVINFCGGGNGIPEDAYVDDVWVVGLEDTYGDDLTDDDSRSWKEYGWVARSQEAAYEGGMGIHAKGYGDGKTILERTLPTIAEAEYTLSFWYQNLNEKAGFNLQIVDGASQELLYQENYRTTEWTPVDIPFIAASGSVILRFVSEETGMAEQFYLDQLTLFTYEEQPAPVEEIKNGTFDHNQPLGWSVYQDTILSAYGEEGNRGALLLGYGGWGALMEQGFFTTPDVVYTLSFRYKVLSNGFNVQIVNGRSNEVLASNWYTANEWTEETITFTATSETTRLNFCGGGNGIPESAYVDDVVLTRIGESDPDLPVDPDDPLYPDIPDIESEVIEAGETKTVTLEEGFPILGLVFTPTESGWYEFTSSGEYNTVGAISDESEINIMVDDNSGEGANFRCVFYCAADTPYVLLVAAAEACTFDVTVQPIDKDALFPQATAIAYGDVVTVELAAGESQVFSFVPETSGTYHLVADGQEDTYCFLCDVEGAGFVLFDDEFAEEDNANFVASYDCIAGNTYYYLVSSYAEESSSFTIALNAEEEPPSPPDEPEILFGDVNGDGKVNNKDLGLLQQYLAGWEITIDVMAADVNNNNRVNNQDLGLLQQYLAGWPVILG